MIDYLIEARDIVEALVLNQRRPSKSTGLFTAEWVYKHPERLLTLIESALQVSLEQDTDDPKLNVIEGGKAS